MIWKLSLTGVRNRRKDYLVLFSGLVVASMIFYMFLTIAINPAFLAEDIHARTSYLNYIFTFGIVLLVIITFIYLLYANTFLLSMRQHDYGMFMMLGAKSTRIGLLIFCETLITGLVAVLLGIIFGLGLTAVVAKLLISRLDLEISRFQVILPSAILWTILFFVLIFFMGALANVYKLVRTPVITLLHEEQTPFSFNRHPLLRAVEAILGIALLAGGYYCMNMSLDQVLYLVPTALVTIVAGTYFIFSAFFDSVISFLLKRTGFSYRGIRMFTLGQLKFRLHDYTRILTMISLLFALALGAITVGLNFGTFKEAAKEESYYDATIISTAPAIKRELAQLSVKSCQTYHYKERGMRLYFNRDEFTKQPLKYRTSYYPRGRDTMPSYHTVNLPTAELAKPHTDANNILSSMVPNGIPKTIHLVPATQWKQLAGQDKFVSFIVVKDFDRDYPSLLKIEKQQVKEEPAFTDVYYSPSNKPYAYAQMISYSSGFEFMGFFLGLAFLTMLASTLMFKVLSGAANDRSRYRMLYQIGTRPRMLRASINREIGTLFVLPAALGITDVLFGLQLFKYFLPYPYNNIWIPFAVFLILYFFYYLLTVKLYKKITLDY